MEKREQMYEGKAKKVYATDDPTLCIVSYKDDATAFNGEKRGTIMGKGVINNRLTNRLMRLLMENGIALLLQFQTTLTTITFYSMLDMLELLLGSMSQQLIITQS